MERYIKARDYKILIYDKEDRESYRAAINALTEAKKMSGWDRVQGVTIHKDCRIPDLYHGDDLAIIMERDNGKRRIQHKNYELMAVAAASKRP